MASLAFLVAVPLLSVFVSPLFLLVYLLDLPAVLVPVLFKSAPARRGGAGGAEHAGFLRASVRERVLRAQGDVEQWIVRERDGCGWRRDNLEEGAEGPRDQGSSDQRTKQDGSAIAGKAR